MPPSAPVATRLFSKVSLPFVCTWVRWHERSILRAGEALSPLQLAEARRIGVRQPEKVRVLAVASVPPRLPEPLRLLAERLGLGPARIAGMALGYGIYLRADCRAQRELLWHELVHTAQYERLGFRPFLAQYLLECLSSGYPFGPLEEEARRVALEFGDRPA